MQKLLLQHALLLLLLALMSLRMATLHPCAKLTHKIATAAAAAAAAASAAAAAAEAAKISARRRHENKNQDFYKDSENEQIAKNIEKIDRKR